MAKKNNTKKLKENKNKLNSDEAVVDGVYLNLGSKTSKEKESKKTNLLTQEEKDRVVREIELEEKFGDAASQAGIEGVARGLTLGISDQVLVKSGITTPEALRERAERNEVSAISGEVIGTVAPAFFTGGASLPAGAATKAGAIATQLTKKQLGKIIAKTGQKTLAKKILQKSAERAVGSAVEAAAFSTGQLVSEDALGKAEFNAENLVGSVGIGAILGGTAGGIFGAAEAIIPQIKKGVVKGFKSAKIKNKLLDDKQAGMDIAGFTAKRQQKLREFRPELVDNIPKVLRDRVKLQSLDGSEKLFLKSKRALQEVGDEIGETLSNIQDRAELHQVLPTQHKISSTIINRLKKVRNELAGDSKGTSFDSIRKKLDDEIAIFQNDINNMEIVSAQKLREMKTMFQKASKYDRFSDNPPLANKINRAKSEALRDELFKLADNVSTLDNELGKQLRSQNLDFGTLSEVVSGLADKTAREEAGKSFLGLKDVLIADLFSELSSFGTAGAVVAAKKFAESDFRRRLVILSGIERQAQKTSSKINKSISNFFTGKSDIAKTAILKSLTKSDLATTDLKTGKKSKIENKKQGLKQVISNINSMQRDPQIVTRKLEENALRMHNTAPNTTLATSSTIVNGLRFLESKLPNISIDKNPFIKNREFEVSSIELSKFERFLEAVENPLSILDDLESGSLSPEAAEAVKSVYPELFQKIQQTIIDKLPEIQQNLSYDKRLQLSLLMDVSTDPSLEPQNIIALQSNFIPLQKEQPAQEVQKSAVNPTVGGLKELESAGRSETDVQNRQDRRRS